MGERRLIGGGQGRTGEEVLETAAGSLWSIAIFVAAVSMPPRLTGMVVTDRNA